MIFVSSLQCQNYLQRCFPCRIDTIVNKYHALQKTTKGRGLEFRQLGLRIGLQLHIPSMQTMNGGGRGSAKALERAQRIYNPNTRGWLFTTTPPSSCAYQRQHHRYEESNKQTQWPSSMSVSSRNKVPKFLTHAYQRKHPWYH